MSQAKREKVKEGGREGGKANSMRAFHVQLICAIHNVYKRCVIIAPKLYYISLSNSERQQEARISSGKCGITKIAI